MEGEVDVLDSQTLITRDGLCGRKATLKMSLELVIVSRFWPGGMANAMSW